jgi:hypothetical protein
MRGSTSERRVLVFLEWGHCAATGAPALLGATPLRGCKHAPQARLAARRARRARAGRRGAGGLWAAKQEIKAYPTRTNQIPRHVPPPHWASHPTVLFLAAGLLPFGTIFVELYFAMTSIWQARLSAAGSARARALPAGSALRPRVASGACALVYGAHARLPVAGLHIT